MLANGTDVCSCKNLKCIRRANCKECFEHHKSHINNKLPYCKRPENIEATKNMSKLSHIIC